jgi:hypothetical protein
MRSGADRADRGHRLHRRVWDLLPWYASGTLEGSERRTVEAHLAACAPCREELAVQKQLGETLQQVPEIAPAPHPAQFARLMARIDAEETAGPRWWAALRDLFTATPRAVRWTLAAQLGFVLLLGTTLALNRRPAAPINPVHPLPAAATYQTLSDPAPAPLQANPASRTSASLRIVFAPGTSEQEIRDLLLGIRGQITAGPSPLGVYTVDVPAGPDRLEDVLIHLRAHKQISFAEPAQ